MPRDRDPETVVRESRAVERRAQRARKEWNRRRATGPTGGASWFAKRREWTLEERARTMTRANTTDEREER
jgi:hypothetical protein